MAGRKRQRVARALPVATSGLKGLTTTSSDLGMTTRSMSCSAMAPRSLQPGVIPRPLTRKEVPAFPPSPDAYFHASA